MQSARPYTTGLPIKIRSAMQKQSFVSEYVLDIDIEVGYCTLKRVRSHVEST
jgi:hypothetical protein